MKVNLRYFASLREALGASEFVDVEPGQSVANLRDSLLALGGAHAQVLARGRAVRCALNQTLCDEQATLADGDELAFFPPVTGG
jgi:sulfur-carrier protein